MANLLEAIRYEQYEKAVEALKAGEDVNSWLNWDGQNGGSALYLCVCQNKHKLFCLLLQYNADVNITDSSGNSPLHAAADLGNFPCVVLLTRR